MLAIDMKAARSEGSGTAGRNTGNGNGNAHGAQSNSRQGLANGLGWFSIGLGLAEVLTPGALASLIGVQDDRKTRGVLRGYGLRELAVGIGILSRPRPAGWVWSRVAGDVLDLSSLASALGSSRNTKARVAAATAAVVGVTALDIVCAQRLSSANGNGSGKKDTKTVRTITVDRSAEEAYRFWRDFENLPKFMTYLDSVRVTGDKRSHWIANGPLGKKIEWDAETTVDEPTQMIAWRTVPGSQFDNAGSVRFERAPGNRGTVVRVEMNYAPTGSLLPSTLGTVLGADIGSRIEHDLRNFKQILEVGEVTQSDASIHESMHAAQPS